MKQTHPTISDLRDHLFATLRGLTDKSDPMDIERAKAVADVAQVIVNSAKVEVEHLRISGGGGSGFIPEAAKSPAAIVHQQPGVTVRRHTLAG